MTMSDKLTGHGALRNLLALSFVSVSLWACKPHETTPSFRAKKTKPADPIAGFYASSETEVRAKDNFYYALFNKDYERKFASLPTTGEVTPARLPYVGSWYPQAQGGTNVRIRGASPLEKYDAVFNAGSTAKAAGWELKNHTVSSNDSSAGWAGHCNGFSAAATRHSEPQKEVTRGSTIFYPEDIKALLAEIHMGAKFYFLGGNRCGLIENAPLMPPGNRQDPLTMGECDDVNPATFHISLTNWIGIQKYPLIVDIHGKEQVWNYPHWKYSVQSRVVSTATEANSLIMGPNSGSVYKFNPAAASFRSVAMTVTHTDAFSAEIMTAKVDTAKRYKAITYNYLLELNAAGEIIGGEWLSTSQINHPDFIWVALEPMRCDGSQFSGNPNLVPAEVIKLWAESIGADPANPPLAFMEPSVATAWGKFPKFDVLVNGAASGAAFAVDDAVEIAFKPKAALSGATPGAVLDGNKLPIDSSGLKAVVSKPASGIHVLEVSWTAGGKAIDQQRLRINVLK